MPQNLRAFLSLSTIFVSSARAQEEWSPTHLWRTWPEHRFVKVNAGCLKPEPLQSEIDRLAAAHPRSLRVERAGSSVEGRPIRLLSLGHGPRKVLLWSQMHGDEPSATPALLDLADALLRSESEAARRILRELTVLMVPMLNPDGAERYDRRNAYGVDLNRDALHQATPEASLLKQIRDEHEPLLGFNLHDQSRRILAGDTGKLATLSLLAVAGDETGTLTPGRERAMRAATAVVAAVSPHIDSGIARYDEDWNPRAFGDNVTRWGSPVVLIESGGLPTGRALSELTRLNFVALAHALEQLAANDLESYDIETYRALPRNKRDAYADLLVAGGLLFHPPTGTVFRGDLAIDIARSDFDLAECQERISGTSSGRSILVEIGDGSARVAGTTVDARGLVLVPALEVAVSGLAAKQWLGARALETLARRGVATVRWLVEQHQLGAALSYADATRDRGRARIEPATEVCETLLWLAAPPAWPSEEPGAEPMTWRKLTDGLFAGSALKASALTDSALTDSALAGSAFGDMLQKAARAAPPFAKGRQGSFLALRAAGPPRPEDPVQEIWLDGQRLFPD